MVASKQRDIPYYRGIGQQLGKALGAFAQVVGRTANPFSRQNVVPAVERVIADLVTFAALEIAEAASGKKKLHECRKECGKPKIEQTVGN